MKYTIADFHREFPNDDTCLEYIFKAKYPAATQYYRAKDRKCWAHSVTGHQIYPLAGTIFEKTSTPLVTWFEAIYLFSIGKNGVSAKELERHFGVTYKTAWRMGHQIRKLMEQDKNPLVGDVEADETFYGKGGDHQTAYKNKQATLGAVERKGRVKAKTAPNRQAAIVLPFIKENVVRGSKVVTDEYRGYDKLSYSAYGYTHRNVKHGKHHMLWKGEHTNTIEGFWGQFKRSVRGTYHFVSPQHLQAYLDEFAFRYNCRALSGPAFHQLLAKVV